MSVPIDKRRPIKRRTQDISWFVCEELEDSVVVCVHCDSTKKGDTYRKVKKDEFYDDKRYPNMIPTWSLTHTF